MYLNCTISYIPVKHGRVTCEDGSVYWFWKSHDTKHRLDGPAIEYANGNKEWYYYGEKVNCHSQEEFEKYLKMKAFW